MGKRSAGSALAAGLVVAAGAIALGGGGVGAAEPKADGRTVHLSSDDLDQAAPGDVVCIDGDLAGDRLLLTKGGTADAR